MGWLGELNLWLAMGRDPDCFLEQRLVVANRDSEVLDMLPLTLANIGEEQMIHKVGGSPEVKKHLEDLGFVAGGTVTVVSSLNGAQDHGLIDQAPTRALEKETEV